jgi:hypothetical protein
MPLELVRLIVARFSEPIACGCLYLEVGEIQPSRHAASARYQLGKLSDIVFPQKSSVLLSRTISLGIFRTRNFILFSIAMRKHWHPPRRLGSDPPSGHWCLHKFEQRKLCSPLPVNSDLKAWLRGQMLTEFAGRGAGGEGQKFCASQQA